ncbi:sulfotransferase domain-containing protein [Bradyrhizobium sp. AUGA SZCCT0182]|uniref:sulfotransferase domain-containing protein n=1 Tax=Bradyrhizobium sp. AUGA SZCCT0182 TaxID=2807667 RepID=UPI001BA7446B|nr:sulfotransferase domain-containing protein [Bradyrhizobium sp. AUGA SZCCT0182]MBR1236304.1 sulfotransferase domain-containing protein [Bradyrhizobium sp. AUGA SZCCT0182]
MNKSLLSRIASKLLPRKTTPEAVRPNFIGVGFPKVGNTWLRMSLGKYVQLEVGSEKVFLMDAGEFDTLRSMNSPLIGLFSHWPLEWETQTAKDLTTANIFKEAGEMRVLLLVRHPLDALVSLYMQNKHRNPGNPYRGSLIQMVDDPVLGLQKYITFYNLWAGRLNDPQQVHLWRYEDARTNAVAELNALLVFLGVDPNAASVAEAVKYGSFENMKSMEMRGDEPKYASSGFSAFATGDRSNNDALHVREGKVGSYLKHFSADELQRLYRIIDNELDDRFGYREKLDPGNGSARA